MVGRGPGEDQREAGVVERCGAAGRDGENREKGQGTAKGKRGY